MTRSCSYDKKDVYTPASTLVISDLDIRRCVEAATLALSESNSRYKMGCVIYSGNARLANGVSSKKSHPFQKKINTNPDKCFLHGEIAALLKDRSYNVTNKRLYIMRVWRNGTYADSFCCDPCIAAILEKGGYSRIYYYDNKEFRYINI